jgi:hypothetical protein
VAKKTLVKDQDQFLVRLPDGMRERIKAKADRAGMSMNEAVVWCLEQHFPAPMTFEQKIDELVEMVALLKGDNSEVGIDRLIDEIDTTLSQISGKTLPTRPEFRAAVTDRYEQYQELEQERLQDLYENPFDDANWQQSSEFVDYTPDLFDIDPERKKS